MGTSVVVISNIYCMCVATLLSWLVVVLSYILHNCQVALSTSLFSVGYRTPVCAMVNAESKQLCNV